jgi:hypothetical protein
MTWRHTWREREKISWSVKVGGRRETPTRGRHGRGMVLSIRFGADGINDFVRCRNVTARGAKALGKRAHHNVHIQRIHAQKLQANI